MKEIYLDNAAATPTDRRVRKEMNKAMGLAGNPSSYNDAGRDAAGVLFQARLKVARFLGARPGEIIFCSSGSEANNMAILGVAFAKNRPGACLITTPIEHLSVLEPVRFLERQKITPEYLRLDGRGVVDAADLENRLDSRTLLVSVMYANNEIGTIQPIAKIGRVIRKWREDNNSKYPLFHVDACQAAGYMDMNVNRLGIDLLTFNGSKVYGPRGVGVLYVRSGVHLSPYIMGGEQEHGLRAGTENVPAIAGLAKALEILDPKEGERTAGLRDMLAEGLQDAVPGIRVNGAPGKQRLPNNVNISVPGLDSENLLIELDKHGIRAGSGSACTARAVEPSHVLKAIGVKKPYLDGVIRFSLGRQTTKKDIQIVLKVFPELVRTLEDRYDRVR